VAIFGRATLADLAAYRAGTLACGQDGRLCRLDRCADLDLACDDDGWPTRDLSTVIADALGCGCGGSCGCGGT
jgi:hypothetical protein